MCSLIRPLHESLRWKQPLRGVLDAGIETEGLAITRVEIVGTGWRRWLDLRTDIQAPGLGAPKSRRIAQAPKAQGDDRRVHDR